MGFSGLNWVAIACKPIALNKQLPILYFFRLTYSGSQKSEVCPMPYALCPMPYALCPMPYALCP